MKGTLQGAGQVGRRSFGLECLRRTDASRVARRNQAGGAGNPKQQERPRRERDAVERRYAEENAGHRAGRDHCQSNADDEANRRRRQSIAQDHHYEVAARRA